MQLASRRSVISCSDVESRCFTPLTSCGTSDDEEEQRRFRNGEDAHVLPVDVPCLMVAFSIQILPSAYAGFSFFGGLASAFGGFSAFDDLASAGGAAFFSGLVPGLGGATSLPEGGVAGAEALLAGFAL
jgi:hypothetical protein